MKVWTDTQGNKLTAREFFSRWKQGIEGVTPMQQTKSNLFGYILILVGIVWGLVVTFNTRAWWLFTILLGSLVVSGLQFLGMIQKYLIFKMLERGLE